MSEEMQAGCTRPSGGPVDQDVAEEKNDSQKIIQKEVSPMIRVGKTAPDFSAPGYQKGDFINKTLSDYLGQWVVLCFYPGDFTFV